MRRYIVTGCAAVLLIAVNGCSSTEDRLLNEDLGLQNDLANIMEKGDLSGSEGKLEKIKTRMEEIGQELHDLNLSDGEKNKFIDKSKEPLKANRERMTKAYHKLSFEDRRMLDNLFYGKDHKFIIGMWTS